MVKTPTPHPHAEPVEAWTARFILRQAQDEVKGALTNPLRRMGGEGGAPCAPGEVGTLAVSRVDPDAQEHAPVTMPEFPHLTLTLSSPEGGEGIAMNMPTHPNRSTA